MTAKFKNKYRIESARLKGWDYGSNATYFVTICTQQREHYFGEIKGGEMQLSRIGKFAVDCWLAIPNHFPFVKLECHVVMPNHVHGVLMIDKPDNMNVVETQNGVMPNVETQYFASLPQKTPQKTPQTPPPNPPQSINKFGPQSQNLASIIRGYKIGVTKQAKQIHADFAWQPRFHDHIIRNEQSFVNIATYIENNIRNWSDDQFYKNT